tara:strand:+ start:4830 stop:6545 length:1716 start_codon:yes stop_codon:yes gene_type:complete
MALSLEDINKRAIQQRAAGRRKPMTAEERFEAEQTVQSITNTINYFSDIYSKWDKKTEQTEQQYLSGEITNPEAVLRDWAATINAVFTPVSDATGAALSAADEAFLSGAGGRGLEAAGEYLSETDAGQTVAQYIQENPRAAENVMAAVDVAGVIPIARIVKSAPNIAAEGMSTEIPGFYGSGVGTPGKAIAAGKVALQTVPRTIKEALSPSGVAYKRETGIDKGKVKREIGKANREGEISYAGAIASNYLQMQTGKGPANFIDEAPIGVANSHGTFKLNDKDLNQKVFEESSELLDDVPYNVQKKFMQHLRTVHGKLNPSTTDVVVKRGDSPMPIKNEAVIGGGTNKAAFLRNLDNGPTAKNSLDEWIKNNKLNRGEKSNKTRIQEERTKITKKDMMEYLKSIGQPYKTEKNDRFIYINTSHHSTSKELGGVNDYIAMDTVSGDTFVMISDKHDMFGKDPFGGTSLLTVAPVVKSNFKAEAGKRFEINKEQKKKRESEKRKQLKEAAENLEKKSGIKRKENETPYNYNFRVLDEYKPNVTAQDYATALRRQGMLTGAAQSTLGAEQEEQNY